MGFYPSSHELLQYTISTYILPPLDNKKVDNISLQKFTDRQQNAGRLLKSFI
jgi:hypothetical protein